MDEIVAPCGLKYIKNDIDEKKPYEALSFWRYHNKRYGKDVLIRIGDRSDGATWAKDIISCAWWAHDNLCENGCWEDGSLLSNWQCSMVLFDILKNEGRMIRAIRWLVWTFLFGGGKCRGNGMFIVKNH